MPTLLRATASSYTFDAHDMGGVLLRTGQLMFHEHMALQLMLKRREGHAG